MAKYRIKDNKTGKTMVVSGDKPPTQEEAQVLFKSSVPSETQQPQKKTVMEHLAGVQQGLSESEALPVLYAILGGLGGGAPGAAAGGATGKYAQQMLANPRRSPQEMIQGIPEVAKTGATAGVLDFLGGKAVEGAGNLAGKAIGKLDDIFKPFIEKVNKFVLKQTLNPAKSQMAKELTEEGVSETFEEASKRGIKGTAQEIYIQSKQQLKVIGKNIEMFIDENKKLLPKIDMKEVSEALDKEIGRLTRMAKQDKSFASQLEKVKEIQKNIKIKGKMNMETSWQLLKDWSQEVSNYYNAGKSTSDIKPYKAKVFKTLADNTRVAIKKAAGEAGFDDWAKFMDDYHFWKNMEGFATQGAATQETAVTMSTRSLGQKFLFPSIVKGGELTGKASEAVMGGMKTGSEALTRLALQLGVLPRVSNQRNPSEIRQ